MKIDFMDGKEVRTTHRILSPKSFEDIGNRESYDTMYSVSERVYNGERHAKTIIKDAKGNITDENELFYDGDRIIKALNYSFLGDKKYLRETTLFNSTSSEEDFTTIGVLNDTVSYMRTYFQDDMRIVVHYEKQSDSQDIWYYDSKNQLVGRANLDLADRSKQVTSYKYDNNGHILEEARYRERINNISK